MKALADNVRRKLAELATQALMVVFAVVGALGAEEWREARQLRTFAERARVAVDLEIERNLAEFRRSAPAVVEKRDQMQSALQELLKLQRDEPASGVELTFEWDLPDVSTAAWRVAQASQAAPYFDYDWMLDRARDYDRLARYLGLLDDAMQDLSALSGSAAANDLDEIVSGVQQLFGRLDVLVQLHEGLQEDMEVYRGRS